MLTLEQLFKLIEEKIANSDYSKDGIKILKIVNYCIDEYLLDKSNPSDELLLNLAEFKLPYIEAAKTEINEHIKILAADEKLDIISELNNYYFELKKQGINLKAENEKYEILLEKIQNNNDEKNKKNNHSFRKIKKIIS